MNQPRLTDMADSDTPATPPTGENRAPARTRFLRRRTGGDAAEPLESVEESVPRGVRLAGAWSWRLLVIGAAIAVLIFLIIQLRLIVIPVLIAVLLAALLVPFKDLLVRHHWPKWLGVVVPLLSMVVVVGGLFYLAIWSVTRQSGELQTQAVQAYDQFRAWLTTGPLGLSEDQIGQGLSSITKSLQQDSQVFISGALSVSSTLGHVLTGALLTLFSVLFILIDGRGIWGWVVRVFPRRARPAVDGAGRAGWVTLKNFVKVQILVAFIDAVGIGIVAFFLGLLLVIPISVLVFL